MIISTWAFWVVPAIFFVLAALSWVFPFAVVAFYFCWKGPKIFSGQWEKLIKWVSDSPLWGIGARFLMAGITTGLIAGLIFGVTLGHKKMVRECDEFSAENDMSIQSNQMLYKMCMRSR